MKLMMLSTSSNDNEALVALRKANTLIYSNSYTWNDLLIHHIDPPSSDPSLDEPPIDRMPLSECVERSFDVVLDESAKSGKDFEFLNSLYEYWVTNKRLSVKQMRCVLAALVFMKGSPKASFLYADLKAHIEELEVGT